MFGPSLFERGFLWYNSFGCSILRKKVILLGIIELGTVIIGASCSIYLIVELIRFRYLINQDKYEGLPQLRTIINVVVICVNLIVILGSMRLVINNSPPKILEQYIETETEYVKTERIPLTPITDNGVYLLQYKDTCYFINNTVSGFDLLYDTETPYLEKNLWRKKVFLETDGGNKVLLSTDADPFTPSHVLYVFHLSNQSELTTLNASIHAP